MDNLLVHFTKWTISHLGRNIYINGHTLNSVLCVFQDNYNRVKLQPIDDNPHSSYINASYIKVCRTKHSTKHVYLFVTIYVCHMRMNIEKYVVGISSFYPV